MKDYQMPKQCHFNRKIRGLTFHYDEVGRLYFYAGELNSLFSKLWNDNYSCARHDDKVYYFRFLREVRVDLLNVPQLKILYCLVWNYRDEQTKNDVKRVMYNVCARLQKLSPKYNFPEVEFDTWLAYRVAYRKVHPLKPQPVEEEEEVEEGYKFGEDLAPVKLRFKDTTVDRLEKMFQL